MEVYWYLKEKFVCLDCDWYSKPDKSCLAGDVPAEIIFCMFCFDYKGQEPLKYPNTRRSKKND